MARQSTKRPGTKGRGKRKAARSATRSRGRTQAGRRAASQRGERGRARIDESREQEGFNEDERGSYRWENDRD